MREDKEFIYTCQSLDVIGILASEKIYYADIEKADCFSPKDPEDRFGVHFHEEYKCRLRWLMSQFNSRRNHDFSSAPIWWTPYRERAAHIMFNDSCKVMIKARKKDIPADMLLPFRRGCWDQILASKKFSWLGFEAAPFLGSPWITQDDIWDKIANAYEKKEEAILETWNEAFNITKQEQDIEYMTPFIDYYWINPKEHETELGWEV